jgi:DNA-binding GntR family transcriptional regulator
MSYAMVACVLMYLDARAGEWVSVPALAQHLGCGCQVVRSHLQGMEADGLVQVRWDAAGTTIISACSPVPAKQPTAWEARQ